MESLKKKKNMIAAPHPQSFDLAHLEKCQNIYFSNKFPADIDTAVLTLRITSSEDLFTGVYGVNNLYKEKENIDVRVMFLSK